VAGRVAVRGASPPVVEDSAMLPMEGDDRNEGITRTLGDKDNDGSVGSLTLKSKTGMGGSGQSSSLHGIVHCRWFSTVM
jgi:hypothetical protein